MDMDSKGLYDDFRKSKDSQEACYALICKFEPLISKLARGITEDYHEQEDVKQELRITFLHVVRQCPLEHFKDGADRAVLIYITKSLKNRSRQMQNMRSKTWQTSEYEQSDDLIIDNTLNQRILELEIMDSLSGLSVSQRKIILASYIYGFSDAEIAEQMHISRQAVHKSRLKALEKLRK